MAGWTLICGACIAILLPGFRFEGTDDTVILVSDWSVPGKVHSVSMQHMNFSTIPITNISRPVAIDYDPKGHNLYWTDVFLKQIRQTSLYDGTDQVLVQLGDSATPDGIAVDVTERLVFYTDAGNDVIAKVDLDTLESHVLIDKYLHEPRAITVYAEQRQLYWTDWGTTPRIETARYDGSDRRTLVATDLIWPNGITLDKQNGRLYWCDAKMRVIESVLLDGRNRTVLLSESTAHYFDIFHHQGRLYFTDWQKQRSILYIPTSGGNVSSLQSNGFSHLAGIHVTSNISEPVSIVTSYTTAVAPLTTEVMEENGSGDDATVTKEEQATPALGESRAQEQSGIHLSFVQTMFVALGCVSVLLLIAVAFLVTFYLLRRRREQRQETYCYLDRQLGQGPFTNNMYMEIGATMDSNSEMYLVPCDELKRCKEDDPIYDEIGDAKKF
ncbi:low-density lipoprotein receptor-related protein 4-like [Haliotis rubra]|uniref:low-density lipoprotein receptor-related protein 4-like n=1 Tax=Haliotis rubra TaxID=36100 RepID=UPI001EE5485F|nr:low-density lipoprotein receptor-related protein 4-like [Haliotis rubra]